MSSRRRPRSFSTSSLSYDSNNKSKGEKLKSNPFRVGSEESENSSSISVVQNAHFGEGPSESSSSSRGEASSATVTSSTPEGAVTKISNDQERQVLIMMLLAHVCSLHDSTPKTYTVHVIELFERGILDRESITFLFELGLLPSALPASLGLLSYGSNVSHEQTDIPDGAVQSACMSSSQILTTVDTAETIKELALTNTVESLRSLEAKAIRRQLSQNECPKKKTQNGHRVDAYTKEFDETCKPWDVEHFPLSLSRYERDFEQVSLLSTGGFGSVFHVVRKLDGCEYAVKRINFDSVGYSNESIQKVIREVQCLALVSEHPNIVRYYTSWLEPSWMTGGSRDKGGAQHLRKIQYDVEHNASPQKLLKDIERFVDSKFGEDVEESSIAAASFDSSNFSDDEESTLSFGHCRHYSWDSSVKSIEKLSWANNRDIELLHEGSHHFHQPLQTSYRTSKNRQSPPTAKTPKPKQYKYQISLYIQMQLCHPATLQDWIQERNQRISDADHAVRIGPALEIFQQLCSGLAHIHEKKIVHRDLKPANAFVSKDGTIIKIGDFGLSKQLHDIATTAKHNHSPRNHYHSVSSLFEECFMDKSYPSVSLLRSSPSDALVEYCPIPKRGPMTAGIGTASYAAPEQVKSRSYGTPADIFSLGLIFLELVCCFETEHERLHHFQLCRDHKVPCWLQDNYPDIANTILACTRINPNERPTAKDILDRTNLNMSPLSNMEIHVLKGKLHEKENLLAEKEKVIDDLRSEMERLKATLRLTNSTYPGNTAKECVLVENTMIFDEGGPPPID